jgi:hypothetical protein
MLGAWNQIVAKYHTLTQKHPTLTKLGSDGKNKIKKNV